MVNGDEILAQRRSKTHSLVSGRLRPFWCVGSQFNRDWG